MLPIKVVTLLSIVGAAVADDSVTEAERSSITTFKLKNFGTTFGSTCACTILSSLFGPKILYPGSAAYEQESTYYWDIKGALTPKCVFVPANAKEIARGVVALNLCQSQFAVRGGGHMPVGLSGLESRQDMPD